MIEITDAVISHALVLERVKRDHDRRIAALIAALILLLRLRIGQVTQANFADMTRAQFLRFIQSLSLELGSELTTYQVEFADWLQRLSEVDSNLASNLYTALTGIAPPDVTDPGDTQLGPGAALSIERLWAKTRNLLIPATGLTIEAMLSQFAVYAGGLLVRRLSMAQGNAETPAQLVEALTGTDAARNLDGITNTVSRAAKATARTLIQHVSANAHAAVGSIYFDRYQWVSVLDKGTTAICRERDGRTYVWGQGPIPPAHVGCRSTIVGYNLRPHDLPPSVDEWLGGRSQAARVFLTSAEPIGLDELPSTLNTILNL